MAAGITEQAVLDVKPGLEDAFEVTFAEAKAIIAAAPGFQSLELQRCIETPSRYLLLVSWERLEDHTEGFRSSAGYEEWSGLLHPFSTRSQRSSITASSHAPRSDRTLIRLQSGSQPGRRSSKSPHSRVTNDSRKEHG